jgi:ribosome hibernation promoting factor
MSVEYSGRNVEVTPSLRDLAHRRTARLERHLGGPAEVRIILSQEKHRFEAEIIASHRRRRWKAQAQEETSGDPRAAVALAFEKIDAQAKRDLEKRNARKYRVSPGGSIRKPAPAERPEAPVRPPAPPLSRIVRGAQHRVPVKPMSTEEAALRLENSRQEFLVFRDSAGERICVLYRRRDGDLGLIVPEW